MTPASSDAIQIENVTRRFEEVVALNDVSLSIRQGEFFSLLGPSGCGKTTLLRIIAGLDIADRGTVRIAGEDATAVPAHCRPVNTVFQSYALFPHLSVWDNVAFGLRMKRVSPAETKRRVESVMALVQIDNLGARRPSQLSGGQKQRVALARAIVNEPKVLLLDEPLAALDLKLRKQLQLELRGLQHRLGITFLYVTHDQEEALVLSDRIAVMNNGKIEQLDNARELYEKPRTRFASQFLGSCNLIEATVRDKTGSGALVQTAIGTLRVYATPRRDRFTLAIRPEKLQLINGQPSFSENVIGVTIEQLIYAGSESHYELRAGGQSLRAELMNNGNSTNAFAPGRAVSVYFPPEALIILDD